MSSKIRVSFFIEHILVCGCVLFFSCVPGAARKELKSVEQKVNIDDPFIQYSVHAFNVYSMHMLCV